MRQQLLDEIIEQISALTYPSSANVLFADVRKIFKEQPLGYPIARVINTSNGVDILGNDVDQKTMGFQIDVFDLMDEQVTQDDAETRYDRMSNIEDILYEWIEKIPNNLENETSTHIHAVNILRGGWNYETNESGIMVNLSIPFELQTTVYVKTL